MSDISALFEPLTIRGMTIPNRLVMAPMTRSFSPGGIPGDNVAEYYQRRGEAAVGLLITEGTTIGRGGASNDENVPNFHTEKALAGWQNVVQSTHKTPAKIGPQLWHVGMMRNPGTGPDPEATSDSPSGRTHTGKQVQAEPTDSEVADMVMAYAHAAGEAARPLRRLIVPTQTGARKRSTPKESATTPANLPLKPTQAPIAPTDSLTDPPTAPLSWAQRLKRTFEIDISLCPLCGGQLRLIADITDPALITKILDHVQSRDPPRLAPRRAPPHSGPNDLFAEG